MFVRLSDLGADDFVMPARLLEWCQDAATLASTAGGYPLQRYAQMNAGWYIREVMLQVDGPIAFGERVHVQTWVSDVRRFRNRREYLIDVDGEVRARAQAEWLFLAIDPDTKKISPYHVDEEMKAAFPRDPTTAIEPDEVLAFGGRVTPENDLVRRAMPSAVDRYGHINHVHYLSWITDHLTFAGLRGEGLQRARIQYQADVRAGDVVTMTLEPTDVGARHEIVRGRDRILRAVTAVSATPE